MIDPINAQLLMPLMVMRSSEFLSRAYLLFPGLREGQPSLSSSSPSSSSSAESSSSDAVSGIFVNSSTSRFSLLPMALTSSAVSSGAQSSLWSKDDKDSSDTSKSIGRTLQKGVASVASSSQSNSWVGGLGSGLGSFSNQLNLGGFLGTGTGTGDNNASKGKR